MGSEKEDHSRLLCPIVCDVHLVCLCTRADRPSTLTPSQTILQHVHASFLYKILPNHADDLTPSAASRIVLDTNIPP